MAIKKKNGHAVTSVMPNTSDSSQVSAAQPQFMDTQGPAANGAGGTTGSKKNSGFPPAQ